jgi:hypothetical protein
MRARTAPVVLDTERASKNLPKEIMAMSTAADS